MKSMVDLDSKCLKKQTHKWINKQLKLLTILVVMSNEQKQLISYIFSLIVFSFNLFVLKPRYWKLTHDRIIVTLNRHKPIRGAE